MCPLLRAQPCVRSVSVIAFVVLVCVDGMNGIPRDAPIARDCHQHLRHGYANVSGVTHHCEFSATFHRMLGVGGDVVQSSTVEGVYFGKTSDVYWVWFIRIDVVLLNGTCNVFPGHFAFFG